MLSKMKMLLVVALLSISVSFGANAMNYNNGDVLMRPEQATEKLLAYLRLKQNEDREKAELREKRLREEAERKKQLEQEDERRKKAQEEERKRQEQQDEKFAKDFYEKMLMEEEKSKKQKMEEDERLAKEFHENMIKEEVERKRQIELEDERIAKELQQQMMNEGNGQVDNGRVDIVIEAKQNMPEKSGSVTPSNKNMQEKKVEKNGEESDISCSICLEDMDVKSKEEDKKVLWLPCAHKFHGKCARQWLIEKGTCPICRMKVEQVE